MRTFATLDRDVTRPALHHVPGGAVDHLIRRPPVTVNPPPLGLLRRPDLVSAHVDPIPPLAGLADDAARVDRQQIGPVRPAEPHDATDRRRHGHANMLVCQDDLVFKARRRAAPLDRGVVATGGKGKARRKQVTCYS